MPFGDIFANSGAHFTAWIPANWFILINVGWLFRYQLDLYKYHNIQWLFVHNKRLTLNFQEEPLFRQFSYNLPDSSRKMGIAVGENVAERHDF